MIRQGTNKPIKITLDTVPTDIQVTLCNEIQTIKTWAKTDMDPSDDNKTYTCPITQSESAAFPEGPCEIEVRWVEDGTVKKFVIHECIEYTHNSTVLDVS